MIFRMNTTEVRAMAARCRRTADMMEMSLNSIQQSVRGAAWQSQAREEFMLQHEALHRSTLRSVEVLRMMALAAEQKARQWEILASRFNSPRPPEPSIWRQVLSMMGSLWNRIRSAVANIRLPSVPRILPYLRAGLGVVGGLSLIRPPWNFEPPGWWYPLPQPHPPRQPWPLPPNQPQPQPFPPPGTLPPQKPQPFPIPPNLPPQKPQPLPQPMPLPRKDENSRPITTPALKEVTGQGSSYTCATYARARRPDLGPTGHDKGSAYNYKNKFPDQTFQIDNQNGNLQDVIGVGYAVVWEPAHRYADNTHGHVAIVEAVYPDHIIISEAVRNSSGVYYIRQKTVSIEELNNNHVWLVS